MRRLRIAVIGAGRLGGFHAQKLAANERVELLAVVDPAPANRNRVAAECRTQSLADPLVILDQLDAAVIAAPTRLHHRLAMECLRRGVHLLVEKPLCTTLAEADELVEAARRKGLLLQVGHVERFNPAFAAATTYTGRVKYVDAVRASGFTFRSTDVGVVLDLMIHDLDLLLSMVRSGVRKVDALGLSVLGGHEDVANARLEFECGCVANLNASRVSYQAVRQMQVWSARAFAHVDFSAPAAAIVEPSETLLRRQFDVDALLPQQVEHYKQHLLQEHLPRRQLQFDAVDALALEQEDFVESIRTSREPRVTGRQARDAIAVAEQILARIHTHAWDDTADGPVGPLAVPRPRVVPAPHFDLSGAEAPIEHKEAG